MIHVAEIWRFLYWDWVIKKPDWDPENPENPKNFGRNVGSNVIFLLTQKFFQVK